MKPSILTLLLSTLAVLAVAQPAADTLILDAPDHWRRELLTFPLQFAPSIELTGVEDVRFAGGWSDADHPEFWTYAFAWHLRDDPRLDAAKIARILETYFDGLMETVSGAPLNEAQKTNAVFLRQEDAPAYYGRVRIYDAFFLQSPITLNVRVQTAYCRQQDRHLAYFRLSPAHFGEKVWEKFAEVRVAPDCRE